jgi:hypothetical protein
MKKVFIKISAVSISLMILATACTKTGATGPTGATGANGSAGPVLTGNLQGVVTLYNIDGTKMLPTTSNPTLLAGDSIYLTNNSTGAVMSTITNSVTGGYMFSNISTGTYSLTIKKSLYGTVQNQDVQFAGGGNIDKNYELSLVPTTTVTSLTGVDTTITPAGGTPQNYVRVRGYVPVSTLLTTVIVYISLPQNTYVNSTPGNFSYYYTTTVAASSTKLFSINIPTQSLYDLGFASGGASNVYFAAYIMGGNTSASEYVDLNSGLDVFTALSSAPATAAASVQ